MRMHGTANVIDGQTAPRDEAPAGKPGPFWGWPGWGLLIYAIVLGSLQSLWWVLIYGGADWLTSLHDRRVRVHFDWELHIPFVPVLVPVYMSINPLFLIGPFILRTRREVNALIASMALTTLLAGVGFLLVPAEPAFATPDISGDGGVLPILFAFTKRVVLRYNMLPSLHVALSTICLAAYATRAGMVGKMLLGAWGAAIAASTLLTHQHHVIDVVTGLALAFLAKRFIYDRWLAQSALGAPAQEGHA
jgi:hypothetical protein